MPLRHGLPVCRDVSRLILTIPESAKGFSPEPKRPLGQELKRDGIVLASMMTTAGKSKAKSFAVTREGPPSGG